MVVKSAKKQLEKIAEQQRKNVSNDEQKYIEVVKYTITEKTCISRIIDVFTNKVVSSSAYLKKEGRPAIYLHTISKRARHAFEDDGYKVEMKDHIRREHKRTVFGIPMRIEAQVNNNFSSGVFAWIRYAGKTEDELQRNKERVEARFKKGLKENGIPLDRICIESAPMCEMLWKKSDNPRFSAERMGEVDSGFEI
jgi:hypothetical protein